MQTHHMFVKHETLRKGVRRALMYLGFISSTALDAISWKTVPLLSELGRRAMAARARIWTPSNASGKNWRTAQTEGEVRRVLSGRRRGRGLRSLMSTPAAP